MRAGLHEYKKQALGGQKVSLGRRFSGRITLKTSYEKALGGASYDKMGRIRLKKIADDERGGKSVVRF